MFKIDPLKEPALAFVLEQQFWAMSTNQILIASGMGVQPQMLMLSDEDWDADKVSQECQSLANQLRKIAGIHD